MSDLPRRKIELTEDERTVCAAVRQLRLDLGMSERQFARQVGCSMRTVYRWEAMVFCPDTEFLPRLSQLAKLNDSLDEDAKKRLIEKKKRKKFAEPIWLKAGIPEKIWQRMTLAEKRSDRDAGCLRVMFEMRQGGK
jgi:transcriptional regulator with XRE-family HTH domain